MRVNNISHPMKEKMAILRNLLENGYIEPPRSIHQYLPSLFSRPSKTSKFQEAPQKLKKKFEKMYSFYAWFLGPFAFTQTKLAKDYFIAFGIYSLAICLLPPNRTLNFCTGYIFNFLMSYIFVYSRFHQSLNEYPQNRSIFSTICLGILWTFLAALPGATIGLWLYPSTK